MPKITSLLQICLLGIALIACSNPQTSESHQKTAPSSLYEESVRIIKRARRNIIHACNNRAYQAAVKELETCTHNARGLAPKSLADFQAALTSACKEFNAIQKRRHLTYDLLKENVELLIRVRNIMAPAMIELNVVRRSPADNNRTCYCHISRGHAYLVDIIHASLIFASSSIFTQEFGFSPEDDQKILDQSWLHILHQLACCQN